MSDAIIKCNGIAYRKGFIEVIGQIHPGHINLEVWGIAPDFNIDNLTIRTGSIPDGAVTGNVELELSIAQTKALITRLEAAVAAAVAAAERD